MHKRKYVCHYRILKQCLENGLVLGKVHRLLQFEQESFIRPYIELNTKYRQAAQSDFERDFYKLLNNVIFGKSMENVLKQVNVKLVKKENNKFTRELNVETLTASPLFKNFEIIDEDFAIIQMKHSQIDFNKPIFIGFSVLEISKTFMYDFHYKFMKGEFEKVQILYTDTDSFIYEVSGNIYDCIRNNLEKFDTSNFSPDNQFNIPLGNKKKIKLMSSEVGEKIVKGFAGCRAKVYAVEVQEDKEIKRAKGVNKCVVKKFTFSDYYNVVLKNLSIYKFMYRIQSNRHILYSKKICKLSLNSNDDKRFLLDDKVRTLAWGHYKISENENKDQQKN